MVATGTLGAQSICIHGGAGEPQAGAPVKEPLVLSSIYNLPKDGQEPDWSGVGPGIYARNGSDNQLLLEKRLAALEGAEGCATFASGVAALAAVFWTYLPTGSHVICSQVCYAAVRKLFGGLMTERYQIQADFVDTTDPQAVAAAIRDNTRLIHVETPGNPTTGISDIAALAALAHEKGILLSVDSTFASPLYQKPLALGADFSIHSMTKYINGHGDAMGGCVLADAEKIDVIKRGAMVNMGGILSPFNAYLITRGLTTLPLRMRTHQQNAQAVAEFLQSQSQVRFVHYPGLASHPQHRLAQRQMSGYSAMLCFGLNAPWPKQMEFMYRLRLVRYALSLGDADSLIVHTPPEDGKMKFFPEEFRGGFFRMSVGLEDTADLLADLTQALEALK